MNRFLPAPRALRPVALVVITAALVLLTGGLNPVLSGSHTGGSVALNPDHPDRYVVKRGDTLWDISAMFLRDPWFWPEIWYVNPQVRNPHLIYPGDVLTLVYVDGQPQIRVERGATMAGGTDRLSPSIRERDLDEAITTIPFEVIGPFLRKGVVMEKDEFDRAPYILSIRDDRLIAGAGNDVYVRGDSIIEKDGFSVVHQGVALVDPDDESVVGYEGIFVGEGTIRRGGDPATLRLNRSTREALQGDRLLKLEFDVPLNFYPRAPETAMDGSIIHVVDGISQIGQYQVVVLNRGARHGLEVGHVLTAMRVGGTVEDRFTSRVAGEKVRLPDEPAGTLMVFKTYDRISYALIMEATREIRVLDRVQNPVRPI
ncbi:MAG: LysM domain-containing protein [Gammaproteobacteria bacterium]|nr:LysM domain-containing protein [Gammaproteobacteria bacterium]